MVNVVNLGVMSEKHQQLQHSTVIHRFHITVFEIESVLWHLLPVSTIFQSCRGGQFYWWRKTEYLKNTTDMLHVTFNNISAI
jgi:hypothetical protein